MELKQIRLVLTLARHRHFGRAAQELGLSQSALSKNLQALEHDLGVPVFYRGPGEVSLTLAGSEVVRRGAAILQDVEEIGHHLERLRGLDSGRLSFGVGPAYARVPVGAALGRFIDQHPGVEVEPSTASYDELIRRLHLGEIEFCVVTVPEVGIEGLTVTNLVPRRVVFYCRADHPLVGADELDPVDLLEFPFVSLPLIPKGRTVLRNALEQLAASSSRPNPRPPIEIADREMLAEVLLSSHAIGIGTFSCLETTPPGELVALHAARTWLDELGGTPGAIVARADRAPTPAAEELARMIVAADEASATENPAWFTSHRFPASPPPA